MSPSDEKKPVKRRQKAKRSIDDHVDYVVKISGWDRWWSFRVSAGTRWESGPYAESGTLTLRGELYRPDKFKSPIVEVTLSSKDGMREDKGTPSGIGGLEAYGDLLRAHIFVPIETMAQLTTLAASGRIAMVHISGTRLRYRHGSVKCIELFTSFDPDEW